MLQVKARRLKQLHWDKIRTPGQATVWAKEQPSVKLNFAELENLFQVCCLPLPVAGASSSHLPLYNHGRKMEDCRYDDHLGQASCRLLQGLKGAQGLR